MNRDIHSQAEQLNKKHRRKRTWYKILSVLCPYALWSL